jgi:RHS repeat-associated protein
LLSSITHYGTDGSSTLPPVTFGYSQQSFTFQTATTWANLYLPSTTSPESEGDPETYYSFNNSFIDLVDMDGDGFPDRVISPYMNPATNIWIQHNNGSNGFANPVPWTIGSQSYQATQTSNDYSWAAVQGSHGRVIDINGDGLPDFLTDPLESYFNGGLTSAMLTNYARLVVQFNHSTNLSAPQSSWTNVNNQWSTTDQTTIFRAVENSQNVLMLDMNGDGLPDRVMTEPSQPYTYYLVQFNTGSNFTGTNMFGPYVAQGASNDINFATLAGNEGGTGNGVSMRMFDINGDGLPDRVMIMRNANGPLSPANQTALVVELNNGYGFEPAINWTNVNPFTTCDGNQVSGISDLGDDAYVAYRDMNGDGLPDRIIACQCTPYNEWYVQFNTGTGFGPLVSWPTGSQGQNTTVTLSGINTTNTTDTGIISGVAMLLDMNGDGLPDRVEYKYPGPSSEYVVELSSGPYPDLLIAASNGIGGVVTTAYKPSTQINNQQSPGTSPTRYLLPFIYYTVSSVSVSDGIYPANTTSYSYTGGYWNSVLRQFDGFAQTTIADPLQMTNTHWFHQAGGRNNSASGEYQDTTNTIGKVGMEFRADTVGSDGNPYKTVLNQINEYSNNLQHFAYVATNIEIDYPATSSSYKATATVYYYNLSNGNVTNETDWGQVTVSVPPASEAFTDTGSDTRYRIIQYASLANANIVDRPQEITLYDNTGVNILRQVNYTYDQNTGNTLQQLDLICPGNYRTNSYTYDSYNNQQSHTDPAEIVTQTTYDSASETFPATTTEGGSFTTSTTYDVRSGKLFSSTDPAGLVVSNRYDVVLRLAEKYCSLTPNGSPGEWLDQYTYTLGVSSGPQNSVLHQESDGVDLSNGHETMTWFDGLGRVIQSRTEAETGQYRVSDTVYDQRGNIEFVSLPYFASGTSRSAAVTGLGTVHGYDPIGRPSQVTASVTGTFSSGLLTSTSATGGDGTSSPVGTASVAYYYNNSDPWTWVVTDEAGTVHRYTRDAYGRTNQIVEVNGSQGYTTLLKWNLASDLLNVTDNAGNIIQYSNNLLGEVVAMADPDMGVWKYQRDYAGRMRQQTDGDGQRINYNYSPDPLGRLLSRQVYDLKGNFYYGVTNVYDANSGDTTFPVYLGQLYKTIDSEGFTEYGYDVRGRKIITRRYLVKNGNIYTNQYTYDDMDRLRSIVYPHSGPAITNIYDTGANLSTVQQLNGTTYYQATAFTPLDQISNIEYAGNSSFISTYTYYPNSKRLQTAQTASVQNLRYTYDAVGDIASISDSDYSGTASAALSNVGYDSLHRLTGFTRNGQGVTFTYDTVGNMLTDTENGSGNYVYSNLSGVHLPHAVKSANGLNYAYDTCGNMLVRGTEALMYNPENRLIALAVSNQVITFGYDAGGNRLWKQSPTNTLQVWIDGNYEEKDGKTLYHISAGKRSVYTYSSDGSVAEYYIPDHLHSAEIMVTVTNSVAVAQHYEYTAYGNSRYVLNTTSFPITRRYTSQSFDEETGLYYYGNSRYYDPVIGRFIQPDTFIPNFYDPQVYDRYAYARDNPLRYIDPDGHAPSDWADSMQPAIDGYYGGYISDSTHTSVPALWASYMGQSIASGYNDMLRLGTGAEEGTVTGFAQDLGRAGGIVLTVAGPADAAATRLAPTGAAAPKVAPEVAPKPSAAKSPTITPQDLTGKTPNEIRQLAKDKGLDPHPTRPDKWTDPVTGKERLRLDQGHIDKKTGQPYNDPNAAVPHAHGYGPEGAKSPITDPDTGNKHFPTTPPSTPQNP